MPRQSTLTPEQIAKVEEMLKAGAKITDVTQATGAKDYQINAIKRRIGLVKPRGKSAKKPAAEAPSADTPKAPKKTRKAKAKKAKAAVKAPAKAPGAITVNDIRAKLESAQKEVARLQDQLVERVTEIEKMIATIKKS